MRPMSTAGLGVLNETQEQVRDMVRGFVEERIFPVAANYDKKHEFPWPIINELGELGLMGCCIKEENGGSDMDAVSYAIAIEEISRGCASTGAICSVHNSLYCDLVQRLADPSLFDEMLIPFAQGQKIGAFLLSETSNGSDAAAASTTAKDMGDYWLLNGSKAWITNGPVSSGMIVFATTDKSLKHKGISALLVPTNTRGVSFGAPEDKLGIHASTTSLVIFEDVQIPKNYLLGNEGDGFKYSMMTLDSGRIGIAAQALGIAQASLDIAAKYANERHAFGKPISSLYAIQHKLSQMACRIDSARLLTWRAASSKDAKLPISKEAAMAKLCASETATFCAHQAIQILGGMGFVSDMPAERYYRDARITEIYEGTSEVMHLVIAQNLLKEYAAIDIAIPAAPTIKHLGHYQQLDEEHHSPAAATA